MRISQNNFFFGGFISNFFLASFAFLFLPLSFLFIFYPLSPFYLLEKFWPQPFKKPGNRTLINLVTWPILPPSLHPKLDMFFWYSSARIWSIFKMDARMDGSVLAVLAAYQNNLVTSIMMTSQVVQCLRVENVPKIRLLAGRVKAIKSIKFGAPIPKITR